jgi:hypothetical protein
MATLTSPEAGELSDNFLVLAKAIGDFRHNNLDNLSDKEKRRLSDLKSSILKQGQTILALSTTLIMDEVQPSLMKIDNITLQINSTIQTLKDIQKGINVAAAIMKLGSTIIRKDAKNVMKAIDGVYQAWHG